mmetsp:Transcript_22403/g.55540  ORF Transcript_22403/g.55540 Transcript_22403/m.55540 type:complete len:948 (-) Transcript_22403:932-3775(-)
MLLSGKNKHKLSEANGDSNSNHYKNQKQSTKDTNMSADGGGGGTSSSGASANRPQEQQLGKDGRTSQPALHLSSDEVNYLIYRYLQESGFVHSSFTFAYESMLGRSNMRNAEKSIPPGALISFLQKGLQYVGIEETLHREQQQQKGNNNNSNNNKRKAEGISSSLPDSAFNLSLLSPVTISAMTRENPPLQLNVPPATAAAAVRARLEAEAQIEADRKKVAIREAKENKSSNGKSRLTGPQSIPPQTNIPLTNPLANAAPSPMSVQAAMSQLQQQQQQQHHHFQQQQQAAQSQQQKDSAGAAALLAQQQRIEIAVLEEQRRQQLQLQLQEQEKLLQLQARNQSMETLTNMSTAAQQQAQGAAILASVAEQMGNNMASSNGGASKKPTSAKKGPKNKGKKQQQQLQQQARAPQPTAPQSEAEPSIAMAKVPAAASLPQNSGFATLGEAVARLEQAGAAAAEKPQYPPERDVVMSDAGAETDNHHPHHRHLQRIAAAQAQHPQTANNILNHMQAELQHAAVQELISMNGKAAHNFTSNSAAEPPQPNGALSAPPQQQSQQPPAVGSQTPKEAAKAVDAIIDREDEMTNAKVSEVLELKLHQSEVFMCAWNSVYTDMIATGSGDASARIWQMGGTKAGEGLGPVKLLPHGTGPSDKKNKDVTTLEWSSDGKLLATGSYDGVARVWGLDGGLVHTLRGHKGPIFSLKWNKTGNYLLSGSYDKTTIVWDVSSVAGYIKQQFEDHQAPALDVDWKDDNTFASCSTDKTVHICRVGENRPLKTYTGHTDEVNAVKWDPSGSLLASCSDDCTAKVWDVNSDRKEPMYDFKSHQQEIYTVKWAPTGPGSKNPEKKPLLATASFDGSVRLWNINDGTCIQVFSRHRDSVYSVAFSPSGNYLASGSLAGQLYIWNVMEGRHIKSFKGKGDIFEVAWNKEETRVAACFSSNVVCILDFP